MNLMGLPENLRQGLHGLGVALPQPTAALLATCVVRIAPNRTCTACVSLPCPTQESRLRNRTRDRTPTKRTLHQVSHGGHSIPSAEDPIKKIRNLLGLARFQFSDGVQ